MGDTEILELIEKLAPDQRSNPDAEAASLQLRNGTRSGVSFAGFAGDWSGYPDGDKFAREALPFPPILFEIANTVVSLAVTTFVFAPLLKYLPETKIPWRPVWPGALATGILFTIGRILIGLYLGRANVGSAYGAAGSVVVLIVWIYYSARIFFFGAHLPVSMTSLVSLKPSRTLRPSRILMLRNRPSRHRTRPPFPLISKYGAIGR